jgi:putative FmdB family regulatory protein
MPMYDFMCHNCGAQFEALMPTGTQEMACRECKPGIAEKVWITKPSNVIGDECDITQENGFKEPRRFTSKRERLRAIAEMGMSEMVRHTPVPGTDKSPHTKSWSAIGPGTLESARLLLERVGAVKPSDEQLEQELEDAVHVGEVKVPIVLSNGRSVALRIGDVYHGTLDPSILKKG